MSLAPSTPPDEVAATRAFVAVRLDGRTWVLDLPEGHEIAIGRDASSTLHVDSPEVAPTHARLLWDGEKLTIREEGGENSVFVNGKRIERSAELSPGDEISVGPARFIAGFASPPTAAGRRAFTHQEFCERLAEEMARAGRSGRPTSLLMVQAPGGEGGRIASKALDSFRAGDVVGTYAHDELELLLPDTAGEIASIVVDRLLQGASAVESIVGLAVAPADGDNPERLLAAARAALNRARNARSRIERPAPKESVRVLPIALDPSTKRLVDHLTQAAVHERSVLLKGEPSSGKGAFARLLHERSARAQNDFVVVRCATLVDRFALDRAFGGTTVRELDSQIARARGGTVLLDEVGDLGPEGQTRLRAALEREGSALRIVATSHHDLGPLAERGAFDPVLLSTISSVELDVPSLRERPGDIIALAESFAIELGVPLPVPLTPGALARLRSYPWPGNVLELRNAMERAVRLADGAEILAEYLPGEVHPAVAGEGRLREHVDSIERDAIVKALAEHNYNQTHAAKRLGISRRALIYKMEKYGLKAPPGTNKRP